MTDEESIASAIAERLPALDSILASEEISLDERPFRAALYFAQFFVLEIRDGDRQWTPDLESPDFVAEKWFRALYQEIESWYRNRYGAALEQSPPTVVNGFVLIWGTPFALKVPVTVTTPGRPGKTVWVSFPDSVLENENPASWLVAPPNLSAMSDFEQEEVVVQCKEIASLLRSIRVKMMGITGNSVVQGFINGVRLHVEVASEHVVREQRGGATPRAYWELQMACECAYKALAQGRGGSFRETHDLFLLHDDVESYGLAVSRELLKKLPRWKTMVELRYGQVADPAIASFYEAYKTMLQVVDAVLAPIVIFGVGKASFEISKAPWLSEEGDEASS